MLEQKVKAAWRAFIAAKDPSADVSERAWEDLHFTERNAWFSAFRVFVVPTDDPQPVQPEGPMAETVEQAARDVAKCLNERDGQGLDLRHVAMLVNYAQQPVQEPVADIKISGDDFDLGLTDAFAFGRLRLPDGHYQLYTSPQIQREKQ